MRHLSTLLVAAIGRRRWASITFVVAQVIVVATSLAQPSINALIIDEGIMRGDVGVVEDLAVAMIAIACANLVAALGSSYLAATISAGSARDLRTRVQETINRFSDADVARFGIASLLTRSTGDVLNVSNFVFVFVTIAVIAPLILVGALILTILGGRQLTPVIAVAGGALCVVVLCVIMRLLPLSRRLQQLVDRMTMVVREQLSGIAVIRTCVRDEHEARRFDAVADELATVSARAGRLQALLLPSVTVIANLATVVVAGVGAVLVDRGEMPIGQIAAATGYLLQILVAVSMFSLLIGVIPRAAISAGRVCELLNTTRSTDTPALDTQARSTLAPAEDGSSVPASRAPQISFAAVTCHWPATAAPAVSEVSLTCKSGKMTGLIGGTGSGKSTLLSAALGLIDPTSGALQWDSTILGHGDIERLRRQTGYVAQDPTLLSGTIAANLRLGKADADDDELWSALETVAAADFVATRPGGLTAEVAQEGKNFSGGQRQRLALARAVVRRPLLYILDDPFSALDVDTEHTVIENLRRTSPDATILIAAQRATSVRHCDTIAVIDCGRIVAIGDDTSLMSESPIYREITMAQAAVGV